MPYLQRRRRYASCCISSSSERFPNSEPLEIDLALKRRRGQACSNRVSFSFTSLYVLTYLLWLSTLDHVILIQVTRWLGLVCHLYGQADSKLFSFLPNTNSDPILYSHSFNFISVNGFCKIHVCGLFRHFFSVS